MVIGKLFEQHRLWWGEFPNVNKCDEIYPSLLNFCQPASCSSSWRAPPRSGRSWSPWQQPPPFSAPGFFSSWGQRWDGWFEYTYMYMYNVHCTLYMYECIYQTHLISGQAHLCRSPLATKVNAFDKRAVCRPVWHFGYFAVQVHFMQPLNIFWSQLSCAPVPRWSAHSSLFATAESGPPADSMMMLPWFLMIVWRCYHDFWW